MVLLYILVIAYFLSINFYAFLLVKTTQENERKVTAHNVKEHASNEKNVAEKPKFPFKLLLTGALGGAIAIYVGMFVFKYRKTDLLFMVLMPVLGVLSIYLCVILLRSGFTFWR